MDNSMNNEFKLIIFPSVPGLYLFKNFLRTDIQEYYLNKIDANEWGKAGPLAKRRVQQYGYKYGYTSRKVNQNEESGINPMPNWISSFTTALVTAGMFSSKPEQMIINEYEPGQGIGKHTDSPTFKDIVFSLTLGSGATITYELPNHRSVDVYTEPGDFLIMSGPCRNVWTHVIKPQRQDYVNGKWIPRGRRISVTFRWVTKDPGFKFTPLECPLDLTLPKIPTGVVDFLQEETNTEVKQTPKSKRVVNVKVAHLRPKYDNFEEWEQDPGNVYIGRGARVGIKTADGTKMHGIKASKWNNPFPAGQYGREECIRMYKDHLLTTGLIDDLHELEGKTLGCWCTPEKCHGDVLIEELANIEEPDVPLVVPEVPQVVPDVPVNNVLVGKKKRRGIAGEKNPTTDGFKNIDVTSGSMNRINGMSVKNAFSPLLIGPVFINGVKVAENFENFWQYGKVFPDLGHIKDGVLTERWASFRKFGYTKSGKGDRHPDGTKSTEFVMGNDGKRHFKYYIPKYAVYDLGDGDAVYNYIESRKKVYVPEYAKLIKDTEVFKEMKKQADSGFKYQILDLDGPVERSLPVTLDMLKEKINDPSAPFGHGYVVAALLAGIPIELFTM